MSKYIITSEYSWYIRNKISYSSQRHQISQEIQKVYNLMHELLDDDGKICVI